MLIGRLNKRLQNRREKGTGRVAVGLQGGRRERVVSIGEYAEKPEMRISLLLHPGEIVVEILLPSAISAGDEAQILQEIIAELELLGDRCRSHKNNRSE